MQTWFNNTSCCEKSPFYLVKSQFLILKPAFLRCQETGGSGLGATADMLEVTTSDRTLPAFLPWVGTLAGVGVTEAGALGLDFFLTMQIRGWQCKSVWDEGKLDGSFRKLEGHLVELIGKQMIIMENTHTIKGRNWKQQR